jgi:hypothetical protein
MSPVEMRRIGCAWLCTLLARADEVIESSPNYDQEAGCRFPGGCEIQVPEFRTTQKFPNIHEMPQCTHIVKRQTNFRAFVTWACEQIAKGKTDDQFRYV